MYRKKGKVQKELNLSGEIMKLNNSKRYWVGWKLSSTTSTSLELDYIFQAGFKGEVLPLAAPHQV